jgi:hypothetical protein
VNALERASFVASPAYGVGHTAEELRAADVEKPKKLAG